MAHDPAPPALPARAAATAAGDAGVNRSWYLLLVALGSFALPVLARLLEAAGAPPAPAGLPAAALAGLLGIGLAAGRARAARRVAAEEPRARL